MLARSGGEQAIATSIVRYAPKTTFPAHIHPLGEEMLVLDGVFEDEQGTFAAGNCVRNPPGSAHSPRSPVGCLLFVRLMQFRAHDRNRTVVLRNAGQPWPPTFDAAANQLLYVDNRERVEIIAFAFEEETCISHHGGLELLVLAGSLTCGGELLQEHGWLRLPPNRTLVARAGQHGCAVWIKTGHICPAIPSWPFDSHDSSKPTSLIEDPAS